MSTPTNVWCPCNGDALVPRPPWEGWEPLLTCNWCQRYHGNVPGAAMGSCLGKDGWEWFHVAAEVARERAPKPGGTVTNVTACRAGTDPSLVRDDWGWTS